MGSAPSFAFFITHSWLLMFLKRQDYQMVFLLAISSSESPYPSPVTYRYCPMKINRGREWCQTICWVPVLCWSLLFINFNGPPSWIENISVSGQYCSKTLKVLLLSVWCSKLAALHRVGLWHRGATNYSTVQLEAVKCKNLSIFFTFAAPLSVALCHAKIFSVVFTFAAPRCWVVQ